MVIDVKETGGYLYYETEPAGGDSAPVRIGGRSSSWRSCCRA